MRVLILAGTHRIAEDVRRRVSDDLLGMKVAQEPKWIEVLPVSAQRLRGLSLTDSDVIAFGQDAWRIPDLQHMLPLIKRDTAPWEKSYE